MNTENVLKVKKVTLRLSGLVNFICSDVELIKSMDDYLMVTGSGYNSNPEIKNLIVKTIINIRDTIENNKDALKV